MYLFMKIKKNQKSLKINDKIYKQSLNIKYVPSCVLKIVIGRGGHYFKITTEYNHIEFIWWNKRKKKNKFWGFKLNNIWNAMDQIDYRIRKYLYLMKNNY